MKKITLNLISLPCGLCENSLKELHNIPSTLIIINKKKGVMKLLTLYSLRHLKLQTEE